MQRFSDFRVMCNKSDGAKVINALSQLPYGSAGLSAWKIAQQETLDAVAALGEPCLYYFYFRQGVANPFALLAFNYNAGEYSLRDGHLYVANVVPSGDVPLDSAEYESIAKQFYDEVLKPFLNVNWPNLSAAFPVSAVPQSVTVPSSTPSPTGQYVSFSFATGSNGNLRTYSCDPAGLADYFGKNSGAPLYMTPVYFGVAVLDKYRDAPSQYTVEEGCLRGISNGIVAWCIPIDNHGIGCVTVALGDLGRLPFAEQHHFASYNISKGQMSAAYQRSQFSAEFCDSTHPVSIFKSEYRRLYDAFVDTHGWELIIPLEIADQHYLTALKLLTHDDQKEFDEQVLSLAKIMVDSLNVDKLKTYGVPVQNPGGINLLEAIIAVRGIKGGEAHIAFLRNLQSIRSASSAHRKGDKYDKVAQKVGLDTRTKSDVFRSLIESATLCCQFLSANVGAF